MLQTRDQMSNRSPASETRYAEKHWSGTFAQLEGKDEQLEFHI